MYMITLPPQLTQVTTFSKILAMILFITLPFVGFLLGIQYQSRLTLESPYVPSPILISPTNTPQDGVACTMDAKICPDGTAVGRIPPTCEFAPCPESESGIGGYYEGRSIYAPEGSTNGSFRLYPPATCTVVANELFSQFLECEFTETMVSIYPEAGGRGAMVEKKDTVTLGAIQWDRTYFDKEGDAIRVSYGAEIEGVYQLIEIAYDSYSVEAEQQVEAIISTFEVM